MTRIVVDPARQIGSVDRNVFGGFVEHLGRCIYGGLYDATAASGVARIDPRARIRPHTPAVLAVDVERLHFFDPATGRAIT